MVINVPSTQDKLSLAQLSVVSDLDFAIWSPGGDVEKPDFGFRIVTVEGPTRNTVLVRMAFRKEEWEMPPKGRTVMLRIERDGCRAHPVRLRRDGQSEDEFFMSITLCPGTVPMSVHVASGLVPTRSEKSRARHSKRQEDGKSKWGGRWHW